MQSRRFFPFQLQYLLLKFVIEYRKGGKEGEENYEREVWERRAKRGREKVIYNQLINEKIMEIYTGGM